MKSTFTQVVVLVEGQTEEVFVKEVLKPYLYERNIWIEPSIINTKIVKNAPNFKGGAVTFGKARRDLERILKDQSIRVTTFFDYYRLGSDFPQFTQVKKAAKSGPDKVSVIEKAFEQAIDNRRFKAYIQIYEFEALLFSSLHGFEVNFADELDFIKGVSQIINQYSNPEEINDDPKTAPSKRLEALRPGYDKIFYGNSIALDNGIESILEKCPRFAEWVSWLTTLRPLV